VADGTHRYVVDYASADGTTSPERSAVVACGGSGTGGGGGAGGGSTAGGGTTGSSGGGGTTGGNGGGATGQPGGGVNVLGACLYKKFRVTIVRPKARRVQFTLDGRRIGKAVKPGRRHRFSITIDPLKFKPGAHTLRARVTLRGHKRPQAAIKLRSFRSCTAICANRKAFAVHIPRKVHGLAIVRAVVKVGKRRTTVTGSRLHKPVHLTHLPKGRWKVDISMYAAGGKVFHSHRVYRPCAGALKKVKRH
jgi:hypothetical protein